MFIGLEINRNRKIQNNRKINKTIRHIKRHDAITISNESFFSDELRQEHWFNFTLEWVSASSFQEFTSDIIAVVILSIILQCLQSLKPFYPDWWSLGPIHLFGLTRSPPQTTFRFFIFQLHLNYWQLFQTGCESEGEHILVWLFFFSVKNSYNKRF